MFRSLGDSLQIFLSDERLLILALASLCLTITLFSLRGQSRRLPYLLLCAGGSLLVLAYALFTPFFQPLPQLNIVSLALNLGWLCIGGGLFLTTRSSQKI